MNRFRPFVVRGLSFVFIVFAISTGAWAVNGNHHFTLRVLTYNVKGLPSPVGQDLVRLEEIGKILGQMRREGRAPHMVAIQEGFSRWANNLIYQAGYPYVHYGAPNKGARHNSGLRILSEFPLGSHRYMIYRKCAGADCLARKSVTFSRVHLPGVPRPLAFMTTHMQATEPTWPQDPAAQRIRQDQFSGVLEMMALNRRKGEPLLFMGDINTYASSPTDYGWFYPRSGLTDAAEACGTLFFCTGEPNPLDHWQYALDHQFYTGSVDGAVQIRPIHFERTFQEPVGGRMLSDHDGLEVHYDISW